MSLFRMVRRPSPLRSAVALSAVAVMIAWFAVDASAAGASPAGPGGPNPGGPERTESRRGGALAIPQLSPGTFATPPAATRVKFRWWQPVAYTNDAEIQREVKAMTGNFGGDSSRTVPGRHELRRVHVAVHDLRGEPTVRAAVRLGQPAVVAPHRGLSDDRGAERRDR